MMFSGSNNAYSRNIFKWKWHGESSLTTELLKDVPPEIELSDYRRVPSPGSESPSGLLNGESLNVEPIADLDLFFERLYGYYCDKGLWCIIIKWIFHLLSHGFIICFVGFFFLYVDWYGVLTRHCGMDAVESGNTFCDIAKEYLYQHPLTPLTITKAIIIGCLVIWSIYWVFCFLRFFFQVRATLDIRHFYYNSLHVTDNEIQTMPWATILEKVVQLQSSRPLCVVKDLSTHDMVMRLMRKENYLIGMVNKGVLAFPISRLVPGAGPIVKSGSDGKQHRLVLTKTLQWTINWFILQRMFDRNFCVRRDFISNPGALKRTLMIVGLALFVLSPFIVIIMLVKIFLQYAEQVYNHPWMVSSRRWSYLSKWIFREFNEVNHLLEHRMITSVSHASDYLKQFPSPIISIIAKFIYLVSGGFTVILIIIAFLNESLLEGHIFGRNLLWYAAVFGFITAISRVAITDELLVPDPEGAMSMVVQHTHYMPKTWRHKENTEMVRLEFKTLFQSTGMMLVEEMASLFLTPYLLLFVVRKRVDDILQFIANFTVRVEGVGDVCSFSVFDFQKHGNKNYGSLYNATRSERSSQGKMEKSFLSFQSSYPLWEPNPQGKQFLQNLRTFREQKMQVDQTGLACSPARMWQRSPNMRGHTDRLNISREIPHHCPVRGHHLDSMWLTDLDQRTRPYLLDWYYTSHAHHATNNMKEIPEEPFEVTVQQPGNWAPANFPQKDARFEDYWGHLYEDRAWSNAGASTSAPFFRESVLRHHDSGNVVHPTRSHWWDRGSPNIAQPQASFLDPPDFGYHATDDHHENYSDRSLEEQDLQLDWRNSRKLSQTTYLDDIESGDFSLHFDDVYSRPPETSNINIPEAPSIE